MMLGGISRSLAARDHGYRPDWRSTRERRQVPAAAAGPRRSRSGRIPRGKAQPMVSSWACEASRSTASRTGRRLDEDDPDLSARPGRQPSAMTFVNGSHQEIDTIFSDSGQFFDDLAWMIEREPHDVDPLPRALPARHDRHREGQAVRPDAERREILDEAARFAVGDRAHQQLRVRRCGAAGLSRSRWEWAFMGGSASWDSQGYVNTDRRAGFAYIAIGMSPAMVEKHVGAGSQYLWTPRDAAARSSTAARNIACTSRRTSRSRTSGR